MYTKRAHWMMNKQLMPSEVATLLRISVPQLCRLTKAGRIPAIDVGAGRTHCWRYDEGKLEQWLNDTQRPRGDATVKRRTRKSTPVQRMVTTENQSIGIQSENGKAHGTMDPMTEVSNDA